MNTTNAIQFWTLVGCSFAFPLTQAIIILVSPKVRLIRTSEIALAVISALLSVPFLLASPNAYDGLRNHHEAWGFWGSIAIDIAGIQIGILILSLVLLAVGVHKRKAANHGVQGTPAGAGAPDA